jgi:multicomponent Na+:H+ antiporter subunit A
VLRSLGAEIDEHFEEQPESSDEGPSDDAPSDDDEGGLTAETADAETTARGKA